MDAATDWALLAKEADSWVAAATLLKAAEVFDERLAALEVLAVKARTEDPMQLLAEVADLIKSLPDSARETVLAQLNGQIH